MKIILRVIILLLLLAPSAAFAQRDKGYEYSSEILYGVNKNSRSGFLGGFFIRYGEEIKENLFQTFAVEMVNVKHPLESRYFSANSGNIFIWAKQNYLYSVRLQYGREQIIFKKAAQQGVQVSAMVSGGPTIGVVAPYFIEYNYGGNNQVKEQYNPVTHSFNGVLGTGNLFQGIDQSKIVPGINARASLAFEFGTFKNSVTGVELGFLVEQFTKEIVLVPTAKNDSFFSSAFITLFWGNKR
jgi:hypothetical protein